MMVNGENQEDKLQRLLDGRDGGKNIDNLLKETEEAGEDLKLIHETDLLLKNIQLDQPSDGFSRRVMRHLDDVKITKALNKQALILFIGVFISLLTTALLFGTVNTESVALPTDLTVVGKDINLDSVTGFLNPKYIMQGLMFITFLLGMMIFDKAILKPFFEKRKMA